MTVSTFVKRPPVSEGMKEDFASLLEQQFQTELKPGVLVVGEILRVEKDHLLVDIGGKSEGYVPIKEVPGLREEALATLFKVGEIKEFYVLREHREEDRFILSVRRVDDFKNWDTLKELKETNKSSEATIVGTTKGGILASILGLKGFIPASQLRVAKPLEELMGDVLPVKVLEVDRSRNKLILSHRMAVFELKSSMREETLSKLSEGHVVEGEVVKITDFGAFVDINGIDGLLPLSEITWRRIRHPYDVLKLGQHLKVQVLTIDYDLQRISLSLKRLETDPWDTVEQQFAVGQRMDGRVSKLLASGALVELTPGVEAFCSYEPYGHIFELDGLYPFEIVSIVAQNRRITLEYRGAA